MHLKILLNTLSIYFRILINAIVAIYTTRLLLSTLGNVDYGLFILIGGVIALLSFLNGALQLATQRFLSISIGKKDWNELKKVFNCSLMLHLLISIIIFIGFKAIESVLFTHFLNISQEKIDIGIKVYNIVIITSCITFITVPYNAIINAREDMWFLAITDIVGSLLRLGAAIAITLTSNTKNLLIEYSFLIMLSTIIVLLIRFSRSTLIYPETKIDKKLLFDKKQIQNQLAFTGWNTLVSFAMVCQIQGIAIILNIFFGTAINAAYGIANQVNALVLIFATTLSTVFSPKIIESNGAGDNDRMMRIATLSSKLSFYAASIIGIPIILENKTLLKLWLTDVPEFTSIFCIIVILVFMVMQMYPGLVRCLFAYGRIKWYQISISILLILPIPIGFFVFTFFGAKPQFILLLVLTSQIISLIVTIYFSNKFLKLNTIKYLIDSILKPFISFTVVLFSLMYLKQLIELDNLRIIIVFFISFVFSSLLFFIVVLTKQERTHFLHLYNDIISKIKK